MNLDDEIEMLTVYGFSRCLVFTGFAGTVHWRCDRCGALVGDPARHHDWHEETS